jgi:hypothetical protein
MLNNFSNIQPFFKYPIKKGDGSPQSCQKFIENGYVIWILHNVAKQVAEINWWLQHGRTTHHGFSHP